MVFRSPLQPFIQSDTRPSITAQNFSIQVFVNRSLAVVDDTRCHAYGTPAQKGVKEKQAKDIKRINGQIRFHR